MKKFIIQFLLLACCLSSTAQTDNIMRKRTQKESVVQKPSEAKPQQKPSIIKKSSAPKKKYTPRSTGNAPLQGYASINTEDGRYEGNFVDGLFCGKGKFTFKDGSYIEGDFSDCAPNGECKYVGSNGNTIYEGNMKDWSMEGEGMMAWGDSTVVVGEWKNNGTDATNATLFTLNGETLFQGPVVNGKFISGVRYNGWAAYYGHFEDNGDGNWITEKVLREAEFYDDRIVFTLEGIKFTMIKVEHGTFTMGSDYNDERPIHDVVLTNDYYICSTEMTQTLWEAVMNNNPSQNKGSNKPVTNVSWNDCDNFINKLNDIMEGPSFRLPTEAEWEFAAKGGKLSKKFKYSGSNKISDVAWYMKKGSSTDINDVGTKKGNELGIYDMSGNVCEWCADWYGTYDSSTQTNPTGPESGSHRVYRGGSYGFFAECCRSSWRAHGAPDFRDNDRGFRLALSE